MFKGSLLIHLAGILGTRLFGPYFLPPRLTVGSLPWFTAEGPYKAVARCWFADYVSFVVHVTWCSTIFSSFSPRVLEQRVSGTLDMTRWNNSMTCSLPWLISLILLSQVTSTVYYLYYSRQWRTALAMTHAEWIWDDPYDDGNFRACQAIAVQTCNVLRWNSVWTLREFFSSSRGRHSETMIDKIYDRRILWPVFCIDLRSIVLVFIFGSPCTTTCQSYGMIDYYHIYA
jgi:hypothetical protein